MNICEHLTVPAGLFPDKEAIAFEGRSFTFAQLDRLSSLAAARLTAAGVREGDRVALMLPNVPAFVVWYYAALRIGGIAVSVSTRLAGPEVAFMVSDCSARVFVADAPVLQGIGAQLPECVQQTIETSESGEHCDGQLLDDGQSAESRWIDRHPHDAALILYTSGTTGFAKGATLSHMNVRSNVGAFNYLCQMQTDDRILLAVPLFHCFGQNALLNSALNVGATLVLQRKFNLNETIELVTDQRVTQFYGVPAMYQMMYDRCQPRDLRSIRYFFSAAAPLPVQVAQRWQEKFDLPIYEGYGLTETSPFASYNHHLRFVPGSIGTPINGVEMKIVDTASGTDCAPGELGEIAIRGPNVMLGYWNRPEDTDKAVRDGWFHSGDIGRMDDDGYFYIVDRVKDMISVGGLKVYPAEVERVLLDHESVRQVAVVGFPHEVFGEQVVAFVVPVEHADADLVDSLLEHAQQLLADYKVPRHVELIGELPRNPSGKVLKTRLREFELALDNVGVESPIPRVAPQSLDKPVVWKPVLRNRLAQTHAANRLEVVTAFVQETVRDMTGGSELPPSDLGFLDAGMDSLKIVELSARIQAEVGKPQEIPSTLVFDYPRICDLAEFLLQAIDSKSSPAKKMRTERPHAGPSPLANEIETMSEDQALEELMKEIGD